MARTKVEIEVSTDTEIALMSRYGRKRELKTLVLNAIAEAVTLKAPWVKPAPKKRKSDGPECICGQDGRLVSTDCPVPSHAADAAAQHNEGELV